MMEMNVPNIRLTAIVVAVPILLLIPFAAMTLGLGVDWKILDFVLAGILLLGAGLGVEVALRLFTKPVHRLIAAGLVLLAIALVWAELAVGVFGSPLAGS